MREIVVSERLQTAGRPYRRLYLTVKALADSELPPEKAALKRLVAGLLSEVENLLPVFGARTIYVAGQLPRR